MKHRKIGDKLWRLAAEEVFRTSPTTKHWCYKAHSRISWFGVAQDVRRLHVDRPLLFQNWKTCKSRNGNWRNRSNTPLQCFNIFDSDDIPSDGGVHPTVRKHFETATKSRVARNEKNDTMNSNDSNELNKSDYRSVSTLEEDRQGKAEPYAIDPITLRKIANFNSRIRKPIKVPTSEISDVNASSNGGRAFTSSTTVQEPVDSVRLSYSKPSEPNKDSDEILSAKNNLDTSVSDSGFEVIEPVDSIKLERKSSQGIDANAKSAEKSDFDHFINPEIKTDEKNSSKFAEIEIDDKPASSTSLEEDDLLDTKSLMKGLKVTKEYKTCSSEIDPLSHEFYADELPSHKEKTVKSSTPWKHPQYTSYDNILPEDVRRMYQRKKQSTASNDRALNTDLLTDVLKYAKKHEKRQEEELFRARNAYNYSLEQRAKNARSLEQKNFFTSRSGKTLNIADGVKGSEYISIQPNLSHKKISKSSEPSIELYPVKNLHEEVARSSIPQKFTMKVSKLQRHGWECIGKDKNGNLVFHRKVQLWRLFYKRFFKLTWSIVVAFVVVTTIMLADASFVLL